MSSLITIGTRVYAGGGNNIAPSLAGVTLNNTIIAILTNAAFNATQPNLSATNYTLAARGANSGGGGGFRNAEIHYRHLAPAGTNSPVFNSADTADNYGQGLLIEVAGLQNAAPDQILQTVGSSNTPATGLTGALSVSNAFVVGCVACPSITNPQGITSPATPSYSSIYIDQSNTAVASSYDYVYVIGSAAAVSMAWGTIADNAPWASALAVFKDTVAADNPLAFRPLIISPFRPFAR